MNPFCPTIVPASWSYLPRSLEVPSLNGKAPTGQSPVSKVPMSEVRKESPCARQEIMARGVRARTPRRRALDGIWQLGYSRSTADFQARDACSKYIGSFAPTSDAHTPVGYSSQ